MTRKTGGATASQSNAGKKTVLHKSVKKYVNEILDGTLVAIDPSCGSSSSDPGYAIYRKGKLEESGIIPLNKDRELPYRLQELRAALSDKFRKLGVLVVEYIPPRRFGRGSATSHSSLLQAMGVALASTDAEVLLRIRPRDWQRLAAPIWSRATKSDEADAIAIGWAIIRLARELRGDTDCDAE